MSVPEVLAYVAQRVEGGDSYATVAKAAGVDPSDLRKAVKAGKASARMTERLAALMPAQLDAETVAGLRGTSEALSAALNAAITPETDKPKRGRKGAEVTVRFYHDGIPVPPSHATKLSSVAWFYTANIDGLPRISTGRLIELLAAGGAVEPTTTEWDVTLPNGVTLSARYPDSTKALPVVERKPRTRRRSDAATATSRLDRVNAAKAERAAVKAAEAAGEPIPATPVLDAMRAEQAKAS